MGGLLFAFLLEKCFDLGVIGDEAEGALLLFAAGGGLEAEGLMDEAELLEVFEGLCGAGLGGFDLEFAALVFEGAQDFPIEGFKLDRGGLGGAGPDGDEAILDSRRCCDSESDGNRAEILFGDLVDGFEDGGGDSEAVDNSAHRAKVLGVEAEVLFGDLSGCDGVAHQLAVSEGDEDCVAGLEARNGKVGVDGVGAAGTGVERDINDLDMRAHGIEFGAFGPITG